MLGGLCADLLDGRATAADTFDRRQLVLHLDAWQMGGQRLAAGRLCGSFIVAQWRGDQRYVNAGGLQDLHRGFGFVEQPSLAGRFAELLPARTVLLDTHQAKRFFQQSDALFTLRQQCLELRDLRLGVGARGWLQHAFEYRMPERSKN